MVGSKADSQVGPVSTVREPACFQSRCPPETTTVDLKKPMMGGKPTLQGPGPGSGATLACGCPPPSALISPQYYGDGFCRPSVRSYHRPLPCSIRRFWRETKPGYDGRKWTAAYCRSHSHSIAHVPPRGRRGTWLPSRAHTRRPPRDARGSVSLRQRASPSG